MKRRELLKISLLGILTATGGAGFLQVYKRANGVREIYEYPDPILRRVSQPVNDVDDKIVSLSRQMIATVRYRSMIGFFCKAILGRGLAAPQLGISQRLIVCGMQGEIKVIINPEIIEQQGIYSGYESCLSLPRHDRTRVNRPAFIKLRYRGLDSRQHAIAAFKDDAALLAHEMDHLDGTLYIDYV